MSIFDYQASIKVTFDQPIVTDPAVVIGTEYFEVCVPYEEAYTITESGHYSSYVGTNAFDGSLTTRFVTLSTMPQWVCKDFKTPVTIAKMSLYMNASYNHVQQTEIQGSDNAVDWTVVASTTSFVVDTGWHDVVFPSPATFRYWRLYVITPSNTCSIYEIKFYNTRNIYDVAAWTVTSNEYKYQPEGTDVAEAYTVRKVTKEPDNLSVTLWLDMFDRMTDPHGDVTVAYNKTLGNLAGDFDAYVESFSLQLTPTNIVPYSQPYDRENLSALATMTVGIVEVVYKYIPAESDTFLIPDQDNTYMDENLSVLANITVVVTKVGDLPL